MKTVLAMETTRPIGIQELNVFLRGITGQMPGSFVSQGPSTAGRLTVIVFSAVPLALEVAEEVLESLPHLCDSVAGLSLHDDPSSHRAA